MDSLIYEMKDLKIDTENIEKFEFMEERRILRSSHIKAIHSLLATGKHFETPLILNQINGKYRVIDGNHRFEAIKEYLKEDNEIKIKAIIYKNLDIKEEREIFTLWSLGIKQTVDDMLQLRKSEIDIWNILQDENFPVTIYRSHRSESVPLKIVLNMLFSTLETGSIFHASMLTSRIIMQKSKEYGKKEAKEIITFFNETFIPVFGRIKDNHYFRSVFIIPLYNVWYYNIPKFGIEELNNRIKKIIGDPEINMWLPSNSADARILIRDRIIKVCDRGKRIKMFRTKEEK